VLAKIIILCMFLVVQDNKHLLITPSSNKITTETLGFVKASTLAKSRSFANIGTRLQSFKSWPKSMAQTPLELAEAGFFYTGTGDRVCCFYCGLRPTNWKKQDSPWKVHRVYSPTCTFMLIMLKEKKNVQSNT